jgi:hypothetical protein
MNLSGDDHGSFPCLESISDESSDRIQKVHILGIKLHNVPMMVVVVPPRQRRERSQIVLSVDCAHATSFDRFKLRSVQTGREANPLGTRIFRGDCYSNCNPAQYGESCSQRTATAAA